MRQAGTLPKAIDPQTFGDYLESIGIGHRFTPSAETWAVWILDENKLGQAKTELAAYLAAPGDPKYAQAKPAAEAVRRESLQKDRLYQKNVRRISGGGGALSSPRFHERPVTLAIVILCVAVYFIEHRSPAIAIWSAHNLGFSPIESYGSTVDPSQGLSAILSGQLWRLITPAVLHVNVTHLVFNMWAMLSIGTLIERRKGSAFLLAMVLLAAIVSDVGQYLYAVGFQGKVMPFVGLSGVVYTLFGYVWMKGRFQPEEGMGLHPLSVQFMCFVLFLGMLGAVVANGAHLSGLILGILMGLAAL